MFLLSLSWLFLASFDSLCWLCMLWLRMTSPEEDGSHGVPSFTGSRTEWWHLLVSFTTLNADWVCVRETLLQQRHYLSLRCALSKHKYVTNWSQRSTAPSQGATLILGDNGAVMWLASGVPLTCVLAAWTLFSLSTDMHANWCDWIHLSASISLKIEEGELLLWLSAGSLIQVLLSVPGSIISRNCPVPLGTLGGTACTPTPPSTRSTPHCLSPTPGSERGGGPRLNPLTTSWSPPRKDFEDTSAWHLTRVCKIWASWWRMEVDVDSIQLWTNRDDDK